MIMCRLPRSYTVQMYALWENLLVSQSRFVCRLKISKCVVFFFLAYYLLNKNLFDNWSKLLKIDCTLTPKDFSR